jgi:hypothetical protein
VFFLDFWTNGKKQLNLKWLFPIGN